MKQIAILGCGWLGLPLAKSLLAKGYSVKGSTTSEEKIPVLESYGIQAFQIETTALGINGDMDSFLENSEILIVDIPPKLRGDAKENFVAKIQNLVPFIENSTVAKVLFVSSTAVYADDNATVTETTTPNPATESGKQLVAAEMLLQRHDNFKTTVIRFGGLIGENRHPARFLAGKQNLENPEAPINLIHQEDGIGIIEKIILLDCWNEIFNAVAPFHPTRKEYYTQKAIELQLPLPGFKETGKDSGKIIRSDKVAAMLHYTFKNTTL